MSITAANIIGQIVQRQAIGWPTAPADRPHVDADRPETRHPEIPDQLVEVRGITIGGGNEHDHRIVALYEDLELSTTTWHTYELARRHGSLALPKLVVFFGRKRRLSAVTPAGDFDYEASDSDYSAVRRADPRIAQLVLHGLGPAKSVVNVGAGAGSYEPSHLLVTPVEPSAFMRSRRLPGRPTTLNAVAEDLPLLGASFDAAMAMVTVHQWSDRNKGLRELRRVSRGPVVILTFDGDELDKFWLADYVPELMTAERRRYPPIDHICDVLGGTSAVTAVPVPIDCTDGFTEAFYARPERFLDPAVRRAQSAWGFVSPDVERRAIGRLRRDLESGEWERRHGSFRELPEFLGSLRLIVATP